MISPSDRLHKALIKAALIQQEIDSLILAIPTSNARNDVAHANLYMLTAIASLREDLAHAKAQN